MTPPRCTSSWPGVMDTVLDKVAAIQRRARDDGDRSRPTWPMIVLRSPKGWTGPKEVDGMPAEGSFRSHQVPLAGMRENPAHLAQLEAWMRSYHPEELFTEAGSLAAEIAALAPDGHHRMTRQPARPTAGSSDATSTCPTSATTPSTSRARAADSRKRRA